MRKLLASLGWRISDFQPRLSALGDWEARLRQLPSPDLVWVPCFRQRDLAAAGRWASRRGVPLVFDPLISAYDKQVSEREKLPPDSPRARRLLRWERSLFQRADRVIADTPAHADHFTRELGVAADNLRVVYVGAEESLFRPDAGHQRGSGPVEILFFGSFIALQGPQVVVEAARLSQGIPARWVLLGRGPLRQPCEEAARGLANVVFEDWVPYEELAERIHRADILLGVFGTTPKADRVIPNKVFQSLACGRPVLTRPAAAYPEPLLEATDSGLVWTPAGDPQALADRAAALAADPASLRRLGEAAATTSREYFSETAVRTQLAHALAGLAA